MHGNKENNFEKNQNVRGFATSHRRILPVAGGTTAYTMRAVDYAYAVLIDRVLHEWKNLIILKKKYTTFETRESPR